MAVLTCVMSFCTDGSGGYLGLVNGFVALLLPVLLYVALFIGGYLSGSSVHADSRSLDPWGRAAVGKLYWSLACCIGFTTLITLVLLLAIDSPTPHPELGCGFARGFPAPTAVAVSLLATQSVLIVFDLGLLVTWPWLVGAAAFLGTAWNAWALVYVYANFAWQAVAGDVLGIVVGISWHVFVTRHPYMLGSDRMRLMRLGRGLLAKGDGARP